MSLQPTIETDNRYWIGFDLGGTKMLATVFDSQFQKVGRARKKTKGRDGMEAGLLRINSVIQDALDDADISSDQVGGLGIGCPGPLDLEKRQIRTAPNLGWDDVPVADSIEKEFKFPVAIANDVDAGVFGEYKFGAGKNARCVFGIFPRHRNRRRMRLRGQIISWRELHLHGDRPHSNDGIRPPSTAQETQGL